ncbi:Lipoprotein-releasing system ATP-binding protein LolD [compost metagenome]
MSKAILKCRNLSKSYLSADVEVSAINNLTIDIYDKDFTVIMGSSGSGKSTLLYLLSGLDNVTKGEVWFEDMRIDLLKEKKMVRLRREKIGFVFQSINLVPNLSIFENVTVPGYLAQKNRKDVEKRARELLDNMDIKQEASRMPSQLSGGQQQRIAIARGLINSPKVLFADEPTGALNSTQGQRILDVFTDINTKGQSIVMVTHDVKAACRANRILFLRDGEINSELNLEKYSKDNGVEREEQVYSFLMDKGW